VAPDRRVCGGEPEPLPRGRAQLLHALERAIAHTSVGIVRDGDLDSKKLDAWLNRLLAEKGTDIVPSKGVLAVRGSEKRIVFQGVHMIFGATPDRPWAPGEPRRNTLVFIGRNLDRAQLVADFEACLAG